MGRWRPHRGEMTLTRTRGSRPRTVLDAQLRPAPDRRPPAQHWFAADLPDPMSAATREPTLLDALREMIDDAAAPPRPRGVRVHPDLGPGSIRPAPGLPEPTRWAAVLALGIAQALAGVRPVSQLQSWMTPVVLADLRCAIRVRSRVRGAQTQPTTSTEPPLAAVPITVVSVRSQCPTPTVVEATVHLRRGPDRVVLAVRLVAHGQRWLCTELTRLERDPTRYLSGPRPARGTT